MYSVLEYRDRFMNFIILLLSTDPNLWDGPPISRIIIVLRFSIRSMKDKFLKVFGEIFFYIRVYSSETDPM